MRTRIHPGLLVLLAAVLLVGAATLAGYGPLATDEPDATAGAPTPTANAAEPSPANPSDTGPGAIPADTRAAPLADAITEPDWPAFERANAKLINVRNAINAPVTPLAREANAACKRLDEGVSLLAALRATCADSIAFAKLRRVLIKRCAAPTPGCARTATRIRTAALGLVDTRRAYARVIRAELPASACRRALLPTGGELRGMRELARAFKEIAGAAQKEDAAALQRAGSTLEQVSRNAAASSDGREPQVVLDEFRSACHLARYPDPTDG